MTETNDFFAETNDFEDTPKKGVEQRKKRDALKDAINQGKAHLLGGKKSWTFKRIDSMNDEDIDNKIKIVNINSVKFNKKQRQQEKQLENTSLIYILGG